MINKISLKDIEPFKKTGIEIENLKKINFIYGANGSGKTVISNSLTDCKDENCDVDWKDNNKLKILVYNKKFREDNFGKGTIAGVFTLGKETIDEKKVREEKQKELEKLKEEKTTKAEALKKQEEKKEGAIISFRDAVWKSVYKKHESNFKEAFKGYMGSKKYFKDELLSQFNNNTCAKLPLDEITEKAKTVFGDVPEKIVTLNLVSFDKLIEIENKDIWDKKIIGKADVDIAKLIQKLNLNDWVNTGREYLQVDKTCPFCQQQTITDEFRKQLGDYFDVSFTESTKAIKSYSDDYNTRATNLINELTQIETNEKKNKETKLERDVFSACLKTLSSQFSNNKNLLKDKIKEPSRSISLVSTQDQLEKIAQIIQKANGQITQHNDIVNNYHVEKKQLTKHIWKYVIEENRQRIERFNKLISGLGRGIINLTREGKDKEAAYHKLDGKIKSLTQNVTSVQPTVDSINQTLKGFGFLNFEIKPSVLEPNEYQIKRKDGELAEATLSEGEITLITFLYFLQLAKGSVNEGAIREERVLVVDDPISSLDSNVLFIVSTLLKEIIKDIKGNKGFVKQIILLTHNIYFHKEVSSANGRDQGRDNVCYWILRKNNEVSSIQCFEDKNPIHTSYELLWNELKEEGCNSDITIQNIMRRIIENYFKILGKYRDDDLIGKFEGDEKIICRSLFCWMNDGSHGISDDLFMELPENATGKYFEVFKKLFKLTEQQSHYDMMMRENNEQNHRISP